MDFIHLFLFLRSLGVTARGYDSIFIVVDIFYKMIHFIPCKKTSDVVHVAKNLFKKIVRLHGFPRNIIINCYSSFVGYFCKTLWKIMDIELKYSFIFHP